jgi:aminocarboxymuconate-semialdehyde decarboxylase
MIIDTHAHFTPQSMLTALGKRSDQFPSVELTQEGDKFRLSFCGGAPTRPLSPKLRDSDMRLEWMESQSVGAQVVGGWLDSFGYELPPEEGEAWSRFMNEFQMSGTDGIKQLHPLATVPLQDGKRAAKVLEEAMKAGFHGVMIGTQPKGGHGNLDDADLDPFWEAAESLDATVYLHPMFGCGDARLNDFGLMNAVGRGTDTTTAVSRMLFSGHFQRYPDLKMVVSHGGGALPYLLGRLERNHEIHPGQFSDPVEGFNKLYFDSVVFTPKNLKFLCSCCGHDHVVMGSDYPFPIGDMEPLKVIENTDMTENQKQMILGKTAAKLFKISEKGNS